MIAETYLLGGIFSYREPLGQIETWTSALFRKTFRTTFGCTKVCHRFLIFTASGVLLLLVFLQWCYHVSITKIGCVFQCFPWFNLPETSFQNTICTFERMLHTLDVSWAYHCRDGSIDPAFLGEDGSIIWMPTTPQLIVQREPIIRIRGTLLLGCRFSKGIVVETGGWILDLSHGRYFHMVDKKWSCLICYADWFVEFIDSFWKYLTTKQCKPMTQRLLALLNWVGVLKGCVDVHVLIDCSVDSSSTLNPTTAQ